MLSLQNHRAFAMPATLLLLLMLITLGAAAPLYTSLEFKATNHYNTGNQAMYSAEAGLMKAVSVMNQTGVTNFQSDVVNRWGTLFAPTTQALPGFPAFSYTATVTADAANPTARGYLTVTGYAPFRAKRVLRAGLKRSGFGRGIGALYLAADSVNTQFSGNAFDIDGNDHLITGLVTPNGTVEPGIATRNDTVTNDIKNALNSQQKDNVRGLDFTSNPLNPSVVGAGGPDIYDLDRIIASILTDPRVVVDNSSSLNGNTTFGTLANPVITRMTAETVRANGNASGAGILIVEGSITINGSLDFTGWIIVRGDTIINDGYNGQDTTVLGNASILGSLWTGDMVVKVGGSAIVDYCEACMNLISPPTGGGYLPRTMTLTSWQEVL